MKTYQFETEVIQKQTIQLPEYFKLRSSYHHLVNENDVIIVNDYNDSDRFLLCEPSISKQTIKHFLTWSRTNKGTIEPITKDKFNAALSRTYQNIIKP
jgi:protein-tyrosine-phosphatase